MGAKELISCFQDTIEQANKPQLRSATEKVINGSKVYKENFNSKARTRNKNAEIIVEENTTFAAAKKYCTLGKTAVLNFANPEIPGGGVHFGAMAQEECLCRSSNLFFGLSEEKVYTKYYKYHRNLGNRFYSDRLIYTKGVTVFKDDSMVPCLMDEKDWFDVDVITCAAPCLIERRYTNLTALKNLFKGRIKNIFEVACDNAVDVIVLGAFGCGAFKNPPEIVAKAFREVIEENHYEASFKCIVFAIKRSKETPCPNIMAFQYEFCGISAEASILRFSDSDMFVQGFGKIEMPSGRILKGGKETNPYREWQSSNKYAGKQFSILGDSISTLEGYNPRGYMLFYTADTCEKTGVQDMKDTWWGEVIDFFGGELLVNNSWSGSRVTRLPSQNELFPSGCSDERTSSLHINAVKPDVIIVYLGTNDWAFGVMPEFCDNTLDERYNYQAFDYAYEKMIRKLKENYPNTEIWCCTLCESFISKCPDYKFPHACAGKHMELYNGFVQEVAKKYRCKLIDLYRYKMPYDSLDGFHPTKQGMSTIATVVIREMAEEGGGFLDCGNSSHEFEVTEQYTGKIQYVCKKCGKEQHIQDELIGTIIDNKYKVLKLLGKWGIYNSYLVREESLNIVRVLKVYDKKDQVYSPEKIEVILLEKQMMMKLNHPTLPCIIDIVESERYIFVVEESIEGRYLKGIVNKCGEQPAEKVIDWGKQICIVLEHIHTFNPPYIHGEISPSNILLMADGKVKLLGGLSEYKPAEHVVSCIIEGYAAPEQYWPKKPTDVRTDIYGLGMTMYRLVTGVVPNSAMEREMGYKIKSICEINPSLPKGLEYIISKCIELEPDNRYQTFDELLHDLNNYLHLFPKVKGPLGKLFEKLRYTVISRKLTIRY